MLMVNEIIGQNRRESTERFVTYRGLSSPRRITAGSGMVMKMTLNDYYTR